jgi:hypothetical protein
VQVNVPFACVVMAPCVQVTEARSKSTVVEELPAKPVPDAVRVEPTAPLDAESEMFGTTV